MDYQTLASPDVVEKTIEALQTHNIQAEFVQTKEEALQRVKNLIPEGSEVMAGSSTTLEQIGFTSHLISAEHKWKNLKEAIVNEQDPEKQKELRRQSVLAEYFLGSVHAVTEKGEIVVASGSGSQLPSYAFTSPHVIWVAGTQKIVPTLEDAMKRVREYVFPLEDARMKSVGGSGSSINKILIIEKEGNPSRKLHLIFVNEVLGF